MTGLCAQQAAKVGSGPGLPQRELSPELTALPPATQGSHPGPQGQEAACSGDGGRISRWATRQWTKELEEAGPQTMPLPGPAEGTA